MVVTGDARLAERVRMLRHHGSRVANWHELIGYNSRLDELQAAVLRVKLKRLAGWNARRRAHAITYWRLLAGGSLTLPVEHGRGKHVYHQFTIRAARRDALREALGAQDIATGLYYPTPVHLQPAFARCAGSVSLPVSEQAAREVLSLPIHPQLAAGAVERVCEALLAAVTGNDVRVGRLA
jgi:dTDP-4-amino-4,6-dideoxygalactose transaminase